MAASAKVVIFGNKKKAQTSERACTVPECDRELHKDGFCSVHWRFHHRGANQSADSLTVNVTKGLLGEDQVVKYEIAAKSADLEKESTVQFRFSELVGLARQLELDFAREHSHLLANMPELPPKRVKNVGDPKSQQFIDDRRDKLQKYFQALVQVPHASTNPHLLKFLGIRQPDEEKEQSRVVKIQVVEAQIEGKVTFFTVEAYGEESETPVRTFSRFNQFSAFNDQMRIWINTHHPELLESVPTFPMKRIPIIQNHCDPSFVESRRLLLQLYLNKLMILEPVPTSPPLLKFAGFMTRDFVRG
jgi:hypothetical protein